MTKYFTNEALDKLILSEDELNKHLVGVNPDDLLVCEDSGYVVCYVFSNISRAAILLSEGELVNKEQVIDKAMQRIQSNY